LTGTCSTSPTEQACVSAERVEATVSPTVVQTNFSDRFFCSAPGRRPASVRTWKPLQMPTTGPPPSAKAVTAAMTGEKRAMAPGRR
jgi:hypothetical protein